MANEPNEPSPFDWLEEAIAGLEAAGTHRTLSERGSPQGPTVVLDGKTCVNFGSNDYLGLAADPRLIEAAHNAARTFGWGGGASPLVSGRATPHADLEKAIASFEKPKRLCCSPQVTPRMPVSFRARRQNGCHFFGRKKPR